MSDVIQIEGLHKSFRRLRGAPTHALRGLDLTVPAGGVFGFLGPNGAGKTTAIRCLLGLIGPSAGRARLLGAEGGAALASVIHRVGAIVEAPVFFPTFTARRNLELLGALHGIGPRTVERTLDRVGLLDRADDAFKTYSLGMKQRLGIAAALLKDPEVLILDEPANGLDPAGIREVRELLRALGAEGRTVFVSSHILHEVQQTCDRVGIVARGRLVTTGPVAEVLSASRADGLVVRVDDLVAGQRALADAGFDATVDDTSIRVRAPGSEAARVTRTLAAQDLWVTELRPEAVDLETVFLELTADEAETP